MHFSLFPCSTLSAQRAHLANTLFTRIPIHGRIAILLSTLREHLIKEEEADCTTHLEVAAGHCLRLSVVSCSTPLHRACSRRYVSNLNLHLAQLLPKKSKNTISLHVHLTSLRSYPEGEQGYSVHTTSTTTKGRAKHRQSTHKLEVTVYE